MGVCSGGISITEEETQVPADLNWSDNKETEHVASAIISHRASRILTPNEVVNEMIGVVFTYLNRSCVLALTSSGFARKVSRKDAKAQSATAFL